MRAELSLCTISRYEAAYLEEWLKLHSFVGVDKFYLFNDLSQDNYLEVMDPWIRAGRVERFDVKQGQQKQMATYRRYLRRARFRTRWLTYIDVDEFLWSPNYEKLPDALVAYQGLAGVGTRWVLFGSSGHVQKPEGAVIESYTKSLALDAAISVAQERARK